jgi:hypothetical protein
LQLPAAYNLYLRCAGDRGYRQENEDLQALLRPVFITSFLLDDMLDDEGFYGAQDVLLSSASSKAAIGLAHLLHARSKVRVIGLTSAANCGFVAGLGCYDQVLRYGETGSLSNDRSMVYIDFAGSAPLRQEVHERLGDKLVFSSSVGFSHRDRSLPVATAGGVPAVSFFAPDRLRKRSKDWGRDAIAERIAEQWAPFAQMAARWLVVVRGKGPAAIERVYRDALEGRITPNIGHMLSP